MVPSLTWRRRYRFPQSSATLLRPATCPPRPLPNWPWVVPTRHLMPHEHQVRILWLHLGSWCSICVKNQYGCQWRNFESPEFCQKTSTEQLESGSNEQSRQIIKGCEQFLEKSQTVLQFQPILLRMLKSDYNRLH